MRFRFQKPLLALTIAMVSGATFAQTAEPEPRLIANPIWLKRPTGAEVAAHYPMKAMSAEIGGRATIECRVDVRGRLKSCKLLSESPKDYDFGKAVLKLSGLFVMSPTDRDGEPTEGAIVRVPMVYNLPGSPG